jgi:hypothetical protein
MHWVLQLYPIVNRWVLILYCRTLTGRSRSRGQAAVEYVLMLLVLSVFGQWMVKYFTDVLEMGSVNLSINMTYFLHTGVGWE